MRVEIYNHRGTAGGATRQRLLAGPTVARAAGRPASRGGVRTKDCGLDLACGCARCRGALDLQSVLMSRAQYECLFGAYRRAAGGREEKIRAALAELAQRFPEVDQGRARRAIEEGIQGGRSVAADTAETPVLTKQQARYVPETPARKYGPQACRDCDMYRATTSGCRLVIGRVSPGGRCDFFERKRVDDPVRVTTRVESRRVVVVVGG